MKNIKRMRCCGTCIFSFQGHGLQVVSNILLSIVSVSVFVFVCVLGKFLPSAIAIL